MVVAFFTHRTRANHKVDEITLALGLVVPFSPAERGNGEPSLSLKVALSVELLCGTNGGCSFTKAECPIRSVRNVRVGVSSRDKSYEHVE